MEISLHARGSKGEPIALDIDTCSAILHGTPINLREHTLQLGNVAASDHARTFRTERVSPGQYQRTAESKKIFASGDFVVDDLDIERAELSVRYTVRVEYPPMISYFEVECRGRVVSFAPVQFHGDVTMQTRLILP